MSKTGPNSAPRKKSRRARKRAADIVFRDTMKKVRTPPRPKPLAVSIRRALGG
jgi:hypothetical protein